MNVLPVYKHKYKIVCNLVLRAFVQLENIYCTCRVQVSVLITWIEQVAKIELC